MISMKLTPKFIGPYQILRRIDDGGPSGRTHIGPLTRVMARRMHTTPFFTLDHAYITTDKKMLPKIDISNIFLLLSK